MRVTCATKSFPWEPTVPTHYLHSFFSNFSFKLKCTFASLEFMFCKFWICCYVFPSRTPGTNTLLSPLSLFTKTLMLPFWRYLTLSLCLEYFWLFWASKYRLTASKCKKCLNSTTQICMCVCLFLVRLTKNMSKVLKHLLKIIPIDRITLTSIHQLSGSYFPLIF